MTQHQEQRRLTVQFGRESAEVVVAADGTLQQLATALADRFSVAPHTIKLLVPGSKGALRLGEDQAGVTVQEAGGCMAQEVLHFAPSGVAFLAAAPAAASRHPVPPQLRALCPTCRPARWRPRQDAGQPAGGRGGGASGAGGRQDGII